MNHRACIAIQIAYGAFRAPPTSGTWGGYRTENGRSLRWRQLFRSDHLGSLTAEDQM